MEELRQRYQAAGQEHVFAYYDQLDEAQQASFLKQLKSIQVETLQDVWDSAQNLTTNNNDDNNIRPYSGVVGRSCDAETVQSSRTVGLQALQENKVAALVLAGGQGTRLGYDGPKGLYNLHMPSQSTLFESICKKLQRLSKLANTGRIPLYIMTSPLNHQATVDYFQAQENFGIPVFCFCQGMLPCMDATGKIILEGPGRVSMAPDGNGGIYPSLQKSGMLQQIKETGVQFLHVFSIDNALILPADPVFMGYCIAKKADLGNKVVWKRHAHEKVGVLACNNHGNVVVEYSEISKEMAEETTPDGRLVYGAANICNHFYTVEFIEQTILPNMGNLYHIANKKIPYYDGTKTVTPTSNNGMKLETFIFDVFRFSKHMVVWEVERSQEFGPVKNAAGENDSPESARLLLSNRSKLWVRAAGGTLTGDVENGLCEVRAESSYAGEGLEDVVVSQEQVVSCPFVL